VSDFTETMRLRVLAAERTVKPSSSTVASAFGGAAAVLAAWIFEATTAITMPGHVVAALTTLVTIGAGYAFHGGRSIDTV
jgi:hypothetical protein